MTRICLLGAAPDTGNLGVNALSRSVMLGVARRLPDAEICVFDNGRGLRRDTYLSGVDAIAHQLCGFSYSRRFYRPESLAHMRLSTILPGLCNPGVELLNSSKAVLDISGGDSFTDLYGAKRFAQITGPKKLVLDKKRRLILLPQTYGPFRSPQRRRIAADIVRRSHSAWARDQESYERLAELLGSDFDPAVHKCGVDVAFLLPTTKPEDPGAALSAWLANTDTPKVGLNISGLIYNDPREAISRYQFKADYRQTVQKLIERFLRETAARILLVPHVHTPTGSPESDLDACRQLLCQLPAAARERVHLLDEPLNESATKWVIAQLDWFCGTRMHATIAALSSGVPTATIAYSDKAIGVFDSCAQSAEVFDPRKLDQEELAELTLDSFHRRHQLRELLQRKLPPVLERANQQMDEIAARCVDD
ncbi:hypothetical protein Maes01_02105 [Microbulbifer aestuariivivens]|uniref:Polysaccharide pyruvyl transferase domain-containing protein n=1 Tax=Microbulbifer aestuariivivens TaxID=1908308 RepID=A0ABP9WTS7_9GAMM